jgi:hypothetical protein
MRRANGNCRSRQVMILPEIGPVDGRTRPAIKFRETAGALASDLGGADQLTRAQMELVRRVSGFAVLADQIEEQLCRGELVDLEAYVAVAGTQARILRTLGLKRLTKPVPTLAEYLEQRGDAG